MPVIEAYAHDHPRLFRLLAGACPGAHASICVDDLWRLAVTVPLVELAPSKLLALH